MSLPDSTASGALGEDVIKPVYFAFLDFNGAEVYANTSGADVTPSGTGITGLDGNTFLGISGQFVELSPIQHGSAGSKSITATLSGIPSIDDDTLAMLSAPANWRGRSAKVWQVIRSAANVQQGGYRIWVNGKMTALNHGGSPGSLKLTVQIEGYLAAYSEASNRTYLDQERLDSGDLSAAASIAIANGNYDRQVVTTPNYNVGYPVPPFYGIPL